MLNTPGAQDGGLRLEIDDTVVIDRGDVYYRSIPSPDDGEGDSPEDGDGDSDGDSDDAHVRTGSHKPPKPQPNKQPDSKPKPQPKPTPKPRPPSAPPDGGDGGGLLGGLLGGLGDLLGGRRVGLTFARDEDDLGARARDYGDGAVNVVPWSASVPVIIGEKDSSEAEVMDAGMSLSANGDDDGQTNGLVGFSGLFFRRVNFAHRLSWLILN